MSWKRQQSLAKQKVKMSSSQGYPSSQKMCPLYSKDVPFVFKRCALCIQKMCPLYSKDVPFVFKQLQFLVRTSFDMSTNKAQGQSLKEPDSFVLQLKLQSMFLQQENTVQTTTKSVHSIGVYHGDCLCACGTFWVLQGKS